MALKKNLNKYLEPAIHVLFWVLMVILPYLFRNPSTWRGFSAWQYKLIINNVILAGLFYLNAYILFPRIYKKKGWPVYLLSIVVIIGLLMFLSSFIDSQLFPNPRKRWGAHGRWDKGWNGWYFTNVLTYVFITGISFSYRIIRDNNRLEKIRKEKENENLKTELSFLRSQVSPHFIFNILNNLVSLARKKSDLLEPSLIQLSNLIRYMLYENDDEKVSLEREIGYLKSYIDLQLLRFGDDVTITFRQPTNTSGYDIEPMLLTAFVENAFKHGVGMVENPHITIALSIDRETHWMTFRVDNTIAPQNDSKDKSSGIGLNNVKRRLELLYKHRYSLEISQTHSIFVADLKLKLR